MYVQNAKIKKENIIELWQKMSNVETQKKKHLNIADVAFKIITKYYGTRHHRRRKTKIQNLI